MEVIAEAGVNHNGSLDLAKELVDVAVEAGADTVKFQTFRADALVARRAKKADYQKERTGADETQAEMLERLELECEEWIELLEYCKRRDISFLSTPFTRESLSFLTESLDVSRIKIASGEITNGPLLLEAARSEKPVILSTGMSTLGEIEEALAVLAFGYTHQEGAPPSRHSFRLAYRSSEGRSALNENVVLLHCVTEYPAPLEEVNLRALDTLRSSFQLPTGLSDHTLGTAVAVAAAAREASVVEKHFTIDRLMEGPDHRASLEPEELASMIAQIRTVEHALGESGKVVTASEAKNRQVARKSLVAARPIQSGQPFNAENLTVKRPGKGQSPMRYWEYLSRCASTDYEEDELIEE